MTASFICPQCKGALETRNKDFLHCGKEDLDFTFQDGYWNFLTIPQLKNLQDFLRAYDTIRIPQRLKKFSLPASTAENPFGIPLPSVKTLGKKRHQSYQFLFDHVLQSINTRCILDLGSGDGWLSTRLAKRGYQVYSVDIDLDPAEGLMANRKYLTESLNLTSLRAEFDYLPLPDQSADVIIYSASFHYSGDFNVTLQEACRVLKTGGKIVIRDTPVFTYNHSGQFMLRDKNQEIRALYGVDLQQFIKTGFLTYARLETLAVSHGLGMEIFNHYYTPKQHIGAWVQKVFPRLDFARYPIIVGTKG
jgi:ubiquinone/menaquinone biosynthesis C-methylase UbiE